MMLSMTGQGRGTATVDGVAATVEVRTVNNRFLKFSFRTSAAASLLESRIEERARHNLRRGSVQIDVRTTRATEATAGRINLAVLRGYVEQIEAVRLELPSMPPIGFDALLNLPGVLAPGDADDAVTDESDDDAGAAAVQSAVDGALTAALDDVDQARRREGAAMGTSLTDWLVEIRNHLRDIQGRAASAPEQAQRRLVERVNRLLNGSNVSARPEDLAREIAIIAERSDIDEEIVRLNGHLTAFAADMAGPESPGRRLDFLTQEMVRETNTIGSKASDATITARVIDIKSVLEKIRELVQNVE